MNLRFATCVVGALVIGVLSLASNGQTFDPATENLFRDSPLKIVPAGPKDANQSPKLNVYRPDFWKVDIDSGNTKFEGQKLPVDKEVKLSGGDCSVKLEGNTGTSSFLRMGYTDTARFMYHGWSYTVSAKVKLKDVKGKVYAQAAWSNDKKKSAKELTGNTDWTELSIDFTLDRGTNTLNYFGIYLEGSGTVWIDDLQLKMVNPEVFKWWQSWNAGKPTAKLSEPLGLDAKAGILKDMPPHPEFDKYSGIKEVKGSKGATGFYYCEKINGKWWLITPEGHGFYKVAMFSPGYPELKNSGEIVKALGNGTNGWSEQAFKRLDSWGFNSVEWGSTLTDLFASPRCPKDLQGKGMSYTYILMLGKAILPDCNGGIKVPAVDWGWQRFPDVFSPEYAQAVKNYCTPGQKGSWFTDKKKDDPWLIGYILADEPPWYGPGVWYGSLTDGFHNLPNTAAGKIAWMDFLKKKYDGKIENLNKSWGAKFESWDAFAEEKVLPRGAAAVEDRRVFMFVIADKWYDVAVKYVKDIDHNHLILGGNATRLYPAVYAAESKNVQVLTASLYNMTPPYHMYPDERYFLNDQVEKWTDKPIMVGMLQAFDDGGGMPGIVSVESAQYRGESWATYLRDVASNPEVVGLFWWAYTNRDEPNNEGYQKNWGMTDTSNRVYLDLLPYVQLANFNVYNYRMGKTPAKLDPPLPSDPSQCVIELDGNVQFRILQMPYPVETYEAELTDPAGKTQTFKLDKKVHFGDFDYIAIDGKLAPGTYKWRARISAGGQTSAWSLPREFQVADAATVSRFKEVAQFVSEGKNWKTSASTGEGQGKVTFQTNAKESDKTIPLAFDVENGQVTQNVTFTCKLAKPLSVKAGYQYSLRVTMQGDTEAGANPLVTIGLKFGYQLTKDYDPIDRGWTAQHELTQDKPTYVRTTIRLPKDQQIEDLTISLLNCRGGVKIVSIQLIPETEYEVGAQLMDYYKPLVNEYNATVGKK